MPSLADLLISAREERREPALDTDIQIEVLRGLQSAYARGHRRYEPGTLLRPVAPKMMDYTICRPPVIVMEAMEAPVAADPDAGEWIKYLSFTGCVVADTVIGYIDHDGDFMLMRVDSRLWEPWTP